MINPDEIRTIALDLPGVTEGLHFRLPTFKIGHKGFITVQKGAAIMALPEELSRELSHSEPRKYELVTRNKKYFVGLKINLEEATVTDVKPLIAEAWAFATMRGKMKLMKE